MTEFSRPSNGDATEAAPMGGIAMMVAGVVHAGVGVAHGLLFTLGLGVAALDPQLQQDPAVALGVLGVVGACFLLPNVVSLALGALLVVFGQRARTQVATPVATGLAMGGFLWGLSRMVLDVMTCSCSTTFMHMFPMLVSLLAVVFLSRSE